MVKWISTHVELPKIDGNVNLLVFVNDNGYTQIRCGRYNEWGFHHPGFVGNSGSILFGVTHWMPLPKPPE